MRHLKDYDDDDEDDDDVDDESKDLSFKFNIYNE